MVCTAWIETLKAMRLQTNVLARTTVVVMGAKGSWLALLGAMAVEVSAGDRVTYQVSYVTQETRQVILSRTCLEQLGVVSEDFHTKGVGGRC